VGIIAVDPTSPFSGGAILGDRVRMQDVSGDPGIFIRSMASRGSLGGLARATADAIQVLDAAGFTFILVETLGAGQAEVDIGSTAHTTIVLQVPGMGDDIQTLKAGILEIADIIVVNKADYEGADYVVTTLQTMLELSVSYQLSAFSPHPNPLPAGEGRVRESDWRPPILKTVATRDEGIASLAEAIAQHVAYLHESGLWQQRERKRAMTMLLRLAQEALLQRFAAQVSTAALETAVEQVVARETDPYTALAQLVENVR